MLGFWVLRPKAFQKGRCLGHHEVPADQGHEAEPLSSEEGLEAFI